MSESPQVSRTARRVLPAVVAAGALAVSGALIPATAAQAQQDDETTTLNGYRNVGYWGQWSAGSDDLTLGALFADGTLGASLTHLNYSFGNVAGSQEDLDIARDAGAQGLDNVDPYTCFISDAPNDGPAGTRAGGDAEQDFLRAYSAEESVLGIADTADQPLAGAMNQVAQLKRLNPDLKVLVSLGGWTWSHSFSTAVSTPENRTALVQSCIDLYIDGNLPEIDGRGGDGAASGIFDGFDLDWEWPGAPDWSQEVGNVVDEENDRANFLAFVKELREALDAKGAANDKLYELSAFLPASPGVITAGGWNDPELWEYLDFGNLQGYDLWGTWDPMTGHQGNIVGDPDHNWGLGLESIVASYTNEGIDPARLNLGLAAYGQGWKDAELEPWQPSGGGVDGGTRPWHELKDAGFDFHYDYVGDQFNAAYAYNPSTREWFSVDDPVAVEEKTKWAIEQGLGGIDFWQLADDRDGDLPLVSAAALRDAQTGPLAGNELTDCSAASGWNALTTYSSGDRVTIDGAVFEALWWTRGAMPGESANSVWQTVAACGVDEGVVQPWFADRVYTSGDTVLHDGNVYVAGWWTRGEVPGTPGSAWTTR
ncbi:glycosyl hydrolase family 18 protein [Microbacterium sp. YY-01]|uniref:glycosyl hydrolase family 18 protein n=1 Tax=Microbacterium sp. YY-01 TaxID=3421634 RepID=UPI003D182BEA